MESLNGKFWVAITDLMDQGKRINCTATIVVSSLLRGEDFVEQKVLPIYMKHYHGL
jgi:hypothetical protein